MIRLRTLVASLAVLLSFVAVARSETTDDPKAPDFATHIKPFLTKYCMECHNEDVADSGFVVESFQTLAKGGDRGAAFVPGKPDESRIVLVLEGKVKPVMPPKKAASRPTAEEIALVRAWVAAGARDSATTAAAGLPTIKPRKDSGPKITAAAYSRDAKVLAVAAGKEILFLDPREGTYFGKASLPDVISAMALSRDGKRLAIATGAAGQDGFVHLMAMPGIVVPPDLKPYRTIRAHNDLVYAMDFSPDTASQTLATCSYDKLVKIWNVDSGAEVSVLKDHSDAVYAVAFSPDAKLLATGAADRAVKVWDVASGRRLYTLGEPTDWVYAVAWSPDGKYLAAGGVDKSIRLWEATTAGGHIVRSTFAHDAAVTRLVFTPDSKSLFSLSEDRTLKSWDTAQMVERQHFDKLPETPFALAITPDAQQVAVGRFDGVVDFFDTSSGKRTREAVPVASAKPAPKIEAPTLVAIDRKGAERGKTVRLVIDGKNLSHVAELGFSGASAAGIAAHFVADDAAAKNPNRLTADVAIPNDAAPGIVRISLKSPAGNSAELPFAITAFPEFVEKGFDDARSAALPVQLPSTIIGSLERSGDVDYYRFDVAAGQELAVELIASAIGSKLEPVLTLTDDKGVVVEEVVGSLVGHRFDRAGTYVLRVRDVDYRGSGEMFYRVNLGNMPLVTNVFPLGLARGSEVDVRVTGVNLGDITTVHVKASESAAPGSQVDVPLTVASAAPLNAKRLVVGEFPESIENEGNDDAAHANALPTPATVNGCIQKDGDVDIFRFTARKDSPLILDINARRIGSPLDSLIEILDTNGQPLPRGTLRSLAKTYTVFRDHDSSSPGIRIEDWRELAVNDTILIGNELVRMLELPKNPDDDAQFFQQRGVRVGFMDTTPAHVPLGTPIYKVSIHPPGTQFPPNGMPIITIPFRNDDGGPQYGKDSRIFFNPPADGEYLVRVSDVRGLGGPNYSYRLSVRPPKPEFSVTFNPTAPSVAAGEAAAISVSCERFDGLDGPIQIQLENLPPGFSAPATTIPAGENSTSFAISAEPGATAPPADAPKLKLVAKANTQGADVVHDASGGLPSVVASGDIITTVDKKDVTIQPGKQAKLLVQVERRNDFKGRIPIEVRGLPHGTRVLDIGLNGILITERETSRVITIFTEPWAQPTEHPFVVVAKREGTNAEHAAQSVLLRVLRAEGQGIGSRQ
jgi:hypothetical protein